MDRSDEVKQALADLLDSLGDIGKFMIGEARAFLRKSRDASYSEFKESVDKTARVMKESGKWALEDIQRTADRVKGAWKLLDEEKDLHWDSFLDSLKSNVDRMGDLSKDTFDLCVNQTKEMVDKQWTAFGRVGEEQLTKAQEQTEEIAQTFKKQVESLTDQMQESGERFSRAVQAAFDAWKKPKD